HDPLPTLWVEATQMTQLFQNLIGNALKFRGKEPPRIHISARERGTLRPSDPKSPGPIDGELETGNGGTGREWLFSVRDNGIGIDPHYAKRIFLIFQRLHTQEEYPGTGIGLAICKKIVEHHGGKIWLASKSEKGTTFYFTIPVRGGDIREHDLLSGQQ
ncbi:MAG: sensor histidine kinase, partial [Candidatus Binatia bacterium]